MKNRVIAGSLVMLMGMALCAEPALMRAQAAEAAEPAVKVLNKSNTGNPMLGFDAEGNILYGGDPSILVDGDTAYCYVGHDTSTGEYYTMPDWRCYSSKDMENWTYEGEILKADRSHITWAQDDVSAWAGQVAKGSNGKYYFYYCCEEAGRPGKSIGVAVSDTATGPFTDIGKPLVSDTQTPSGPHTWEDIDPTIWIETDEQGVEHRYLGWGNNRFFVCELNEDMISIKDQDGNANNLSVGYGKGNDIVIGKMNGMEIYNDKDKFEGHSFTEAPYYYRQQDENGNYYGPYYMFFACDWREQMAYATTDDIMSNDWEFGGVIMEPSATGNTNHMAVFDFKGETYFVYHDGSMPHGSGFRRVACVEKFDIKADGSIDPIKKTATGLTGTVSKIADWNGNYIASETFENTCDDKQYPMTDWNPGSFGSIGGAKDVVTDFFAGSEEREWEIVPGKADKTKAEYVSIESNYKPGLYLKVALDKDGVAPVVLAQDAGGTEDEANRMTFKTVEGLAGYGVTFESVVYPGYYLVSREGKLYFAKEAEAEEATFFVSTEAVQDKVQAAQDAQVLKTTRFYTVGEKLDIKDICVFITLPNGKTETIKEVTTNASEIDMDTTGEKNLEVTYSYDGTEYTKDVKITVVDESYR